MKISYIQFLNEQTENDDYLYTAVRLRGPDSPPDPWSTSATERHARKSILNDRRMNRKAAEESGKPYKEFSYAVVKHFRHEDPLSVYPQENHDNTVHYKIAHQDQFDADGETHNMGLRAWTHLTNQGKA